MRYWTSLSCRGTGEGATEGNFKRKNMRSKSIMILPRHTEGEMLDWATHEELQFQEI